MELGNSYVYKSDKKQFNLRIKPEIEKRKEINIFCAFTHITPTYSLLFTLNELKKITDSGNFKVFFVMWDMNTLVNPFFKRLNQSRKIKNTESFIEEKMKELKTIAHSIGFDKDKFYLYKSSDLWKRLVSYKGEDLFQQFYLILSKIQNKNFTENKSSHVVQNSMDIFFCNYFHKLYPEDTDREMDLAFFGIQKEKIYSAARDIMSEEGLAIKKLIFIRMEKYPFLEHDLNLPNWDHSARTIRGIMANCSVEKEEIFQLFKFIASRNGKIKIKENEKINEIDYDDFLEKYKSFDKKELIHLVSQALYYYLKDRKKSYLEISGEMEESILNISRKEDLKNIGNVLRSDPALKILLLADGTKNITEISKSLGKSVANISMYVSKLKKMNLLRSTEGGLRRNIKGVKINFEMGDRLL